MEKGVNGGISRDMSDRLEAYRESVRNLRRFKDAPLCSENPFTPVLSEVIAVKDKKLGMTGDIKAITVIDDDTGEATAGRSVRTFFERKLVDSDKFIKLYQSQLKVMFSLTGSTIKVFGYFISQMQGSLGRNRDYIYFDMQECIEFCKYHSHGQVYRGLMELVKKEFIAVTSKPYLYYINPIYAFNGDRVFVFQEFVRKDSLTRAGEKKAIGDGDSWYNEEQEEE